MFIQDANQKGPKKPKKVYFEAPGDNSDVQVERNPDGSITLTRVAPTQTPDTTVVDQTEKKLGQLADTLRDTGQENLEKIDQNDQIPPASKRVQLIIDFFKQRSPSYTLEELESFSTRVGWELDMVQGFEKPTDWKEQIRIQKEAVERYILQKNLGNKERLENAVRWLKAKAESPYDPKEIGPILSKIKADPSIDFNQIMNVIDNNSNLLPDVKPELKKGVLIEYLNSDLKDSGFIVREIKPDYINVVYVEPNKELPRVADVKLSIKKTEKGTWLMKNAKEDEGGISGLMNLEVDSLEKFKSVLKQAVSIYT